jgi:DNA-binding transcriptional MerR regulator
MIDTANFLTTNEVSHALNVSPRCLQNWDETTLLSPQRVHGLTRRGQSRAYSADDVFDVALVLECLSCGLTLQQIRKVFKPLLRRIRGTNHRYALICKNNVLPVMSSAELPQALRELSRKHQSACFFIHLQAVQENADRAIRDTLARGVRCTLAVLGCLSGTLATVTQDGPICVDGQDQAGRAAKAGGGVKDLFFSFLKAGYGIDRNDYSAWMVAIALSSLLSFWVAGIFWCLDHDGLSGLFCVIGALLQGTANFCSYERRRKREGV